MSKSTVSTHVDLERTLDVHTDMTITKDDLVAIRVAEVERQLHEAKLAIIAERRELDKEYEAAQSDRPKVFEEVAIEAIGSHFDKAITALNAVRSGKELFTVSARIEQDEKTGRYAAYGCISGIHGTQHDRELSVTQSKRLVAAMKRIEAAAKAISSCEERMLDVKRKLNDIPALERQVKAAVARAVINDGGDGSSLLSVISRVTMPGLPAPKG
jgi:hypothetical protein